MLTGEAPFAVPAVMLALAGQPIPIPGEPVDTRVGRETYLLIAACLAEDPERRPSMRVLVEALSAQKSA
jgi:hypothetical protein